MTEIHVPEIALNTPERRVLMIALGLNVALFLIGMVAALISHSAGLMADSLDMLADAVGYSISLAAIGRTMRFKAWAAGFSGAMLMLLGVGLLLEVIRRFCYGSEPVGQIMMGMPAHEDNDEAKKQAAIQAAFKIEQETRAQMRGALFAKGFEMAPDVFSATELYPDTTEIFDAPVNAEILKAIKEKTGANVMLRFHISDYGKTPKTWRNGYVAFEVVSTLAIAGAAYASHNPEIKAGAGAYLIEETGEEILSGFGGFWALNRACRPVRIEAELIDLNTGEELWEESNTGLTKPVLKNLVHSADAQELRSQLNIAAAESIDDLTQDLRDSFTPR